ncbi:MAG: hypothetical protein Q7L07_16155, partial [Pseudohongiella sp.]|nr:hypothetical protein [Pseudohongiella sp.]
VLTAALAAFGSRLLWQDNQVLVWMTIILNVGTGVGMIVANARQLRSMDEMQQRITLNAMGIALGAGLVGGITLSLLESSELIAFEGDISRLIIVIGLTYGIAIRAGHRYYR